MSSRIQFIISRLQVLQQRIQEHDPFDRSELAEEEQDFINKWGELIIAGNQAQPEFLFDAQELLSRFIRCYPNLVPLMHRELLYFVGGECLHFLGDEELAFYQQIDEQLYDAEQAGKSVDIDTIIEANLPTAQGETLQ
ncbi:PA2817 family protein [Marinomonas fungiae]|uniref:PA2817 family protein n=1 Tax=Marinomonas fungiae TaxID=1137284 RepID=UPI003A9172DD